MLSCRVEYNYMRILAALGTFLALTRPNPKLIVIHIYSNFTPLRPSSALTF